VKTEYWKCPAGHGWFIARDGLMDCNAGYFKSKDAAKAYARRPKLTFDEALQAINDERYVDLAEVSAAALRRAVWVAEWHIPGCMSESRSYCTTKRDAIESALSMASDSDGPPRGMLADLKRYGRSDKVSVGAYVSMAITTVSRHTLGEIL
jgi:hypothetical protein